MADSDVTYREGRIHDVMVRPLAGFLAERGWLSELLRRDEPGGMMEPAMANLSMTVPGG